MIFSHGTPFSIYKNVAPPSKKGMTKPLHSYFESSGALLYLAYSPWSDIYVGGGYSGLAPTGNVCSLAQVA